MDRIDILGDEYDRYKLFTKDLLDETDDAELQEIVKEAAKELNTPMGLVSLILEQIQFFKAQTGLPEILETSRGTHRDASFCQFVVRDEEIFEVTNAAEDQRIPQHVVKEFNIQSYLGVPIKIDNVVIGSLCVLDTKTRNFTQKERQMLYKLSEKVNQRLETLTKSRKQTKLDLTYRTLNPAFSEISDSIRPIQKLIDSGHSNVATIRSFLNIANQFISIKSQNSETIKMSLEAAIEANELIEDRILNIEMNVLNSIDSLDALKNLLSNFSESEITKILISAQDLTRNATKAVGGFPMPDIDDEVIIQAKADLAIALISNCLLIVSAELKEVNSTAGIQLHVNQKNEFIDLEFTSTDLTKEAAHKLFNQLNLLIGTSQRSIVLKEKSNGITISLKIVKSST
ncbi:GAF domain-containing protein [Marivirga harenae]|uniref:GAF domain-containing protein n=1 Tax=Marivirga harenae TaxID=2010992 RepID=UPI0026DFA80F|nr:GAF domain-containing protein [Marivirga harenae]WKV12755.1 GAF domain-containing protein [Marivirga harenae]|tara:strand:- start:2470 stop:3672 length:1203 start_codon:yes stop_codon:yes gene_type:complete